jgi:hypothetical protein
MPAFDAPQQLLPLVVPVLAYLRAARDARRTRLQLVAPAALGGAAVGLLVCVVLAAGAPSWSAALTPWPFVPVYTISGAFLGVAGVVARAAGAWLARRP